MLLDTPICDFGWKAPGFTLNDPAGRSHALREHLGDRGLLIMFICNHCPYVKAIATRLADDTRTLLDEGIGVLAVMSNDWHGVPVDSPPNMARFAAQHRFAFPYLVDEDQSVAAPSVRSAHPIFSASTGTAVCNTAAASTTPAWAPA